MRSSFALFAAGFLIACGSSTAETGGTTSTTTATVTNDGGASTTSTTSAATGGGGGAVGPHDSPLPAFIPKVTGTCPALTQGKNTFTAGGISRDVLIWMDPEKAKTLDGPLVYFWHGAGGDPSETTWALGSAVAEITAMGGIVAAPYHDPKSSILPWYLCLGGADETDLRIADEILACAIESVGVDMRRIHSVGFSAGAMNTEQFAARRSGYIASIVAYSGARLGVVEEQDSTNKYPAMLFHGGPNDMVVVNFETSQKAYHDTLMADGHFSFLCNHGKGHTVPSDGRASAWQFLKDHPFGTLPEPYAGGLPTGFPSYCSL